MIRSAGQSDVSSLMDGSTSLASIIAVNDAFSRARLESILLDARQAPVTSSIAPLCCNFIRSIASSSTAVPIFEVNLILQFLAGSFSVRQNTFPDGLPQYHEDDEVPMPRSARFGSSGIPSLGSTADAIRDAANGLPVPVLLELFPRLCERDVWGTRSILEDCASAAIGAVCYLVAVQLVTVTAGGQLQASPLEVGQVSDFSWELILRTLPWIMTGRVHSAASLLLYLSACICCTDSSPHRFLSFICTLQRMFPDGDAADRSVRPAPRVRVRSLSPPLPSHSAGPASACIVSENVSAAVVATLAVVFEYWCKDTELNHLFHPELQQCIEPLLSLLLSAWKMKYVSGGRVEPTGPLSADEREEVDYALGRQSHSVDIAALVQQQFNSIPNFHEIYESRQAELGEALDDIVRGFRDARLCRIDALDNRLGDLLSRNDVASGMRSAIKRSHLRDRWGYSSRTEPNSFSDGIRGNVISLLRTMLAGPSVALYDPTQPELMPDSLQCERLHPHLLEKRATVYGNGRYNCDVCSESGSGWVFHCQQCGWDAHPACAAIGFSESLGRTASTVQNVQSVTDLLHSSRSMFFDSKCSWLTCACDELTVAFSQSTNLAEKLKSFLCEVMNIVSGDGHSSRYQILHSLSCATLKSKSQNVTWGLAGVLLREISKRDIQTCFLRLHECSEADASYETSFASTFSLLIVNITASLLEFATAFDTDCHLLDPQKLKTMSSERHRHETFARIVFDLLNCIQRIFELCSEGGSILIDCICRDFTVSGRYHAINRHVKDAKISLIDSLTMISAHSSKLHDFHSAATTTSSQLPATWPGSCSSAISAITENVNTVLNRSFSPSGNIWTITRAVECVLRLLITQELPFVKQALFSVKVDSMHLNNVPFLKTFLENEASSVDESFCENLLIACLIEMNRLISIVDLVTLGNDFIVSGLIEALVLLLSDSQAKLHAGEQLCLSVFVRRRIFYKIVCETRRSVSDPSSTFLRLVDSLKLSVDDDSGANRPSFYHGIHSASSIRTILHDLSSSQSAPLPPSQNIHDSECAIVRHDNQFLSKMQDALKYKDRRLLPQPRGLPHSYYQYVGDRREQGFTQTLSFQDPQDWHPLQTASAAPVRMWLCRRKCPLFNLEGRRVFVKENGVIGCGQNSCGDDTRSDYAMCQACSAAYKSQPPDFSTAIEIFPSSSFNDAVLMLPHHSPISADPITNRAGAVVNPGSGMVLYCGRNLGRVQTSDSDFVCGPTNGPQCADCAFSFPIDEFQSLLLAEARHSQSSLQHASGPFARTTHERFPRPPAVPPPPASGGSFVLPDFGVAARLSQLASNPPAPVSLSEYIAAPPPSVPVTNPSAPDPLIISQLVELMGYNHNAATRAVTAGTCLPLVFSAF
jgi:hypothetical protein